MLINCDIGERELHPVDLEMIQYLDIANLACGGHAGAAETIAIFRKLAVQYDVRLTAHLSYPDKENFGRHSLKMTWEDLRASLKAQYALLSDIKWVKFHGALYNDSCVDEDLAKNLLSFLREEGVTTILAPHQSVISTYAKNYGVDVIAEAFVERRYRYDEETKRLGLVSRQEEYASIHDLEEVLAQAKDIAKGAVKAIQVDGAWQCRPIEAQTLCIHSDSPIALDILRGLKEVKS